LTTRGGGYRYEMLTLEPPRRVEIAVPAVADPEDAENGRDDWRSHVMQPLESDHAEHKGLWAKCVPVMIAIGIGLATAITGSYNAMGCEFMNDFRSGLCVGDRHSGFYLMDRNRCCGGGDNIEHSTGKCLEPDREVEGLSPTRWVLWSEITPSGFFVYVAGATFFAGLSSYLCSEIAPFAKGSGIPDAKASVSGYMLKPPGVPGPFAIPTLLIKCVALSFSVGAGLALGKEGPLIQIGACYATVFSMIFDKIGHEGVPPMYSLRSIGAAAGVATAFGAPLGGVLFVVEELGGMRMTGVSRKTLLQAFIAAFTAAFTLKFINMSGTNKITLFEAEADNEWAWYEAPFFLLLGISGGLLGMLFIVGNVELAKKRKAAHLTRNVYFIPKAWQEAIFAKLPARCMQEMPNGEFRPSMTVLHVLEVSCIGLVTGLTNYPFTEFLKHGPGDVINALFQVCPHERTDRYDLCATAAEGGVHGYTTDMSVIFSLVICVVIRLCQCTITFGAMVPAGLFIPSLLTGAAMGRAFGHLLLKMGFEQAEPALYAMVGAAGMLSGFTHLTVSLVVILFELTGPLQYILPFMLACVTARSVGQQFTTSIYDRHGHMAGFVDVEESENVRFHVAVGDVVTPCRAAPEEPLYMSDLLDWCRAPVDLVLPNNAIVPSDTLRAEVMACANEHRSDAVVTFSKNRHADVDLSHLCVSGLTHMIEDTPLHTIYCMFEAHKELAGVIVGDPPFGAILRQNLSEVLTEVQMPLVLPAPCSPRAGSLPQVRSFNQKLTRSRSATNDEPASLVGNQHDGNVFD